MKKLQTIIFILLTTLLTLHAQRGRVQIQDGTIVSDRGTLLRGAYYSTDYSDYIPSEEEIACIKNLGLNTLHLYAECAAMTDYPGQNYLAVDSIVNMTERDSLYLVMTIGNCGEEGSFDSAFVNDFWKFYASRYKDRTHIVYEIMNEPFSWYAPYDSMTLAMERRAYDTIRFYAPETHVLFMSFAGALNADSAVQDIKKLGDVDWSNASIATHGYQAISEEARSFMNTIVDSGYAITCTEFESIKNEYINLSYTRVFEEEFISYLHFLHVPEISDDPSVYISPIESSEIRWNPDFGTWPESLASINYRDPYQRIEAGFFDVGAGCKLHFLETIIGYISNGDYVGYYNFDFEDGPDSLIFECSAGNLAVSSGSIELILDSLNGTSVGLYPIPHTDDWDDYQYFRFPITTTFEGVHKFYFVFRADHPWDLMNLKSFTFKKLGVTSTSEWSLADKQKIKIYPNPASDFIRIELVQEANIRITDLNGRIIQIHEHILNKTIDIQGMACGLYLIQIETKEGIEIRKFSIEK